MDQFRSSTTELSSKLAEQIWAAWSDYVDSKVNKGLPEDEKLAKGAERAAWPALAVRLQDKVWKQDCLKRDEKFEMHFTAAVRIFIWLDSVASFHSATM